MTVPVTVYVTAQADLDLEAIAEWIARDNPERAVSFLNELAETGELYAGNPDMGADRSELLAGVRSFTHGNYVAYYRRFRNGIQLVRVLHGRRERTGGAVARGLED